METPITRAEHEEFRKRMEDENHRQNRRIEEVEEEVRQIGALTISVEKLASGVDRMVKEQEKQGARLEVLENRDGEKWRNVVGHAITAIISIVVGFIFARIGM